MKNMELYSMEMGICGFNQPVFYYLLCIYVNVCVFKHVSAQQKKSFINFIEHRFEQSAQ